VAGLRGRVRAGAEAAEGPHLGTPRPDPGSHRDRRQQQAGLLAALIGIRAGQRPRLVFRVHAGRSGDKRKGFTEAEYARLLDAAHQQLGGPIVLVWDNLNTHVSKAMRALVAARDWLTVFQLPPYASELNPVESVWSHLKRSLANLIKRDIAQLKAPAKTRLRRMQYRHSLIEGFLAGTRLDLTPL
jgi:putative transposase